MNFIDIDNFITSYLSKHIRFYNSIKETKQIYESIDLKNLGGKICLDIQKDLKLMDELQFYENILFLYKSKTGDLIKNFIQILKTPIRKDVLKETEIKKKKILNTYLNTIKLCIPYTIFEKLNVTDENSVDVNFNYCENCENTEDFIKENDVLICKKCFSEVIKMAYYNNRSYNLNASKCNYDRISHFKECLKQYQGKQNTFINPKVYSDIENALYINQMIVKDDSLTKLEKFKGIKKSHITYFLKELGYTKHYDDYILIHSNLTGQRTNNISHLEDALISDFEKISEKYSELYNSAERKNFINIQFILYQLLIKYNYKFDPEDFPNIKSTDKKIERDKICMEIFKSLNWKYDSV